MHPFVLASLVRIPYADAEKLPFVANLVANVPAYLLNAIVGRMSVSLSDIKSDIKKDPPGVL
jgi:hypothetical protein